MSGYGYDPIDTVLARLDNVQPRGRDAWTARCPSHDDRHASLSIGRGDDGRALVKCFAGCAFADIVAALRLHPSDLFATRKGGRG
jgi:putative DNA primase/helicase